MEIRKAKLQEIEEIMKIYEKARLFMRAHGNASQWVQGYPQRELVEQDCRSGNLYVCEEEKGLAGVFMFFVGEEPDYQTIYQGEWLNQEPYGTMHRMASAGTRRGIASFCLDWCWRQCGNVKGDTHEDNLVMQRVFEKNGFQKCGIIYVKDGTPRTAYQKVQ